MRFQKLDWTVITILILICILLTIGWVANIIVLYHMNTIMTGEGVIRIIGIFIAPIGSIMGWFF